jgi:hypothetical protein
MTDFSKCSEDLRKLMAEGQGSDVGLAERSIDEYVAATEAPTRTDALRNVQQVVLAHRDAASGDQRDFAEIVNDYIEKLMRSFE